MSHVATAWVLPALVVVASCGRAPAPKAADENPDAERNARMVASDPECRAVEVAGELRVLDVGRRSSHLSGDGTPPREGDRFVVLGNDGWVGVLAPGAEVSLEGYRDGSPDFEREGTWMEGPTSFARFAVGPTDAVSRGARVLRRADPPDPLPLEWQTLVSVDLDGDGRADVEQRTRRCGCWEAVRESRVRHGEQWTPSVRIFVPNLFINPHATRCPAVP